MNFLAHLYLSGDDEHLTLGNFIGDSVKGLKALEEFPEGIREGIMLHRNIDHFMDTHPIVRKGTSRIRKTYGKWSPIIMDMYYDHLLAINWHDYSSQNLESFIHQKYLLIENNLEILPGKVKKMFPYMKESNWLLQYRSMDGLETIFKQMDRRTGHRSGMSGAVRELESDYTTFYEEFSLFFDEIDQFVQKKRSIE